jgi:ribonuclease HII
MPKIRHVGVDEVGRGPLAGPVSVCAVAVKPGFDMHFFRGVTDSKKMTKKAREEWSRKLHLARKKGDVEFTVASVSAKQIDKLGIAKAVWTAVRTALKTLDLNTGRSEIFLDGSLKAPGAFKKQKTIIGGDGKHKLISAASVVAKVHRDRHMSRLGEQYPKYGLEIHKGYGTVAHRRAIKKHGKSAEHRKSFCKNIH